MASLFPNQPLPPNLPEESCEIPSHTAYNRCLEMERNHCQPNDTYCVHARFLGYLIRELPPKGRQAVADEVNLRRNKDDELKELSAYYINRLVRPLKGTHNEYATQQWTPDEFEKAALRRDNYRCVVTGFPDPVVYDDMTPEQRQEHGFVEPNLGVAPTRFCHIFNSPLTIGDEGDDLAQDEQHLRRSLSAIIESFGPIALVRDKNGIHDLANGVTMMVSLHTMFGRLLLWFEHLPDDPQPNTYWVRSVTPLLCGVGAGRTITLKSTDPSLPLPRPEYFRLHAAVCRVVRLSGVGQYLDRQEEEIETLGFLARDGSSADLLSYRLLFL